MPDSHHTSKDLLSAMIITYNEEANIYRTLDSLRWLSVVLIVDSGSTDQTLSIVSEFANTRVVYRKFDTFANQCNFGLDSLSSEWILSLDADYVLSPELSNEISNLFDDLSAMDSFSAFQVAFSFCINGKPIRSGLLPPRTCIYRRNSGRYVDEGHGHRVVIAGKTGFLKSKIYHDDRKPIVTWLLTQAKYQNIEAHMLWQARSRKLPIQDLIRKHSFLAPFSAFFMCLILRRGFMDGKEGIIYAFQRFIAESLLFIYMHSKYPDKT